VISVSPKKLQPGRAQRSVPRPEFLTHDSSWQLPGSTTLASSVFMGRAAQATAPVDHRARQTAIRANIFFMAILYHIAMSKI